MARSVSFAEEEDITAMGSSLDYQSGGAEGERDSLAASSNSPE